MSDSSEYQVIYECIALVRSVQRKDSVHDTTGPSRWAKQNAICDYLRAQVLDRYNRLEYAGIEEYRGR